MTLPRRAVFQRQFITGAVALGLALRLLHYARNPSMWHDEAATSLNVLRKSFGELLGPLYVSATGPPLFLWAQKCMVLVLGDSTYALRVLSVAASCAGLLLFARTAGGILTWTGALAAVGIVACSDRLLWHAAEARHYSTDFLIGTLVLHLFVSTKQWELGRRLVLFVIVSPLLILASYPGVFLCAGLYVALWPEVRRSRRWVGYAALGAVIAGTFLCEYALVFRAQRTAAMDAAWVHHFPDWQHPWSVPLWVVRSTVGMVDYMTRPIGGVLIVGAMAGCLHFARRGERELLLLGATPVLLAMIAGLASAYPYTGARTMVFAMPAATLFIGAGFDEIRTRSRVAAWMLALPIAATLGWALFRAAVPWERADSAGAAAYVEAHRSAGEPVTGNHWEHEYYFRKLGAKFYPDLRLPEPGQSAWVVLTANDPAERTRIGSRFKTWHVLDQREFVRTTVLHVARDRTIDLPPPTRAP